MARLLGLLLLACCLHNAFALYSSGSPVVQLDPNNIKSKLKTGAWMVEFYAP